MRHLSIFIATALAFQLVGAAPQTPATIAIQTKMAKIESISGSCFKNLRISPPWQDFTIVRFISTIALNTVQTIEADFTQLKSKSRGNCEKYDQFVTEYLAVQNKKLEQATHNIENCINDNSELKGATEAMTEEGRDLTDLYVDLTSIDFSHPAACAVVELRIKKEALKK